MIFMYQSVDFPQILWYNDVYRTKSDSCAFGESVFQTDFMALYARQRLVFGAAEVCFA